MLNTFEAIQKRMKARLVDEYSRLEGTWSADNLQAVANELARIYKEELEPVLPKAFLTTATGKELDLAAADYGMERNQATFATVYLYITGDMGEYSKIKAAAGNILFEADSFTMDITGTVEVKATCLIAGSIGNVAKETITEFDTVYNQLSSVINKAAAFGGYDEEPDDSFRTRVLEKIKNPAISGNVAEFKKWALENTGVNKAIVYPCGRGNGTVDIILTAENNLPAPKEMLDRVKASIDSKRLIGADVMVFSASQVELKIEAALTVQQGCSMENIKLEFCEKLKIYCDEITLRTYIVSYIKIADLFLQCEGVVDVTECSINGAAKSLTLTEKEFPVPSVPALTITEETNVKK